MTPSGSFLRAFVRPFSGKPLAQKSPIVIVTVDAVVDLVLPRATGMRQIGQEQKPSQAPVARRALSTGVAIVCDRDDRDRSWRDRAGSAAGSSTQPRVAAWPS